MPAKPGASQQMPEGTEDPAALQWPRGPARSAEAH